MASALLVGILVLLVATFALLLVAMAHFQDVDEDHPYAHGSCSACGAPLPDEGAACAECDAEATPPR